MALDFIAGCLGGCGGVLVGHPFDTVKVRLQTQDVARPVYRSTLHCFSTIIRNESTRGLFKGMSSPMAGLAVINAIVFGTYGNLQRAFTSPNCLMSHFCAGSAAGLVQSLIASPMELAKTRMQLQGQGKPKIELPYWKKSMSIYSNPLDCLHKVFKLEGFHGIFRGLGCTILRDSPGFGVYFAGYEYLTKKIVDINGNISTMCLMLAGGLAGVTSWIIIYPFDVIKSRLQVDGMDGSKKYTGVWDCICKSYQMEGIKVFSRGLNSTIVRAFPTNAATFTIFAWVFTLFDAPVQSFDMKLEMRDRIWLMDKEFSRITACLDVCV